MKCEKIEELLSPYLENDLSSEEKAAVKNHLQTCSSCSSLLSRLEEIHESLTDFPELDVSQDLRERLYALPRKKRKFSLGLDFFLRPSLQPVLAVASIFFIMISFYFFHPNKKSINQSLERQVHLGYSKIVKLYTKGGYFKEDLNAFKNSVLDSLQKEKTKLIGGDED
jgi:predicted anti-sigma-YlaC factor YlaD